MQKNPSCERWFKIHFDILTIDRLLFSDDILLTFLMTVNFPIFTVLVQEAFGLSNLY